MLALFGVSAYVSLVDRTGIVVSETKEKQESRKNEPRSGQFTQIFPIAGIGASAGGLDAIKKLLESLPQDTGLAFVIIQHLAINQESMLPEILARSTQMPVNKIEDGMPIEQKSRLEKTPGIKCVLGNT